MHKYYQPTKPDLWSGRSDSLVFERMYQMIECVDLSKDELVKKNGLHFALLGFQCDVGVKRNLGRAGAKEGPQAIRKALANLAAHGEFAITDVGDIICFDDDLESAQAELGDIIALLHTKDIMPLVLGGGHEIAWGHFQGLTQANPGENIGIINFDAHYDLRPLLPNNLGTSGTPFLQIAKHQKQNNLGFDYLCIGIQATANTKSLMQTAQELHVTTIFANEIRSQNFKYQSVVIEDFIEQHDKIYLTFCLDVMHASICPGVSAQQALGLMPQEILPLINFILQSEKVISFDIAECAPCYDQDEMTAKFAANLLAIVIQQ